MCGVLSAFDAGDLINNFAKIKIQECPINLKNEYNQKADSKHSMLNVFFNRHIHEFEVGHRNRLAECVWFHLRDLPQNQSDFTQGFEKLVHKMEIWWDHMTKSANKISQYNEYNNQSAIAFKIRGG